MPAEWTNRQKRRLEAAGYEVESVRSADDGAQITRFVHTGWAPRSEQFQEGPLGLGFTCLVCGCHVDRQFTRKHRARCAA